MTLPDRRSSPGPGLPGGLAQGQHAGMQRDFIDIDGRSVHFHHGGRGAALLMVHQSPRSAAELLPLAEQWSDSFTCIVPDTPGFGSSDPLPTGSGLDEYADALAALVEALGLSSAALYGEHTGAIIALAAAVRHPSRVSALAAHGYAAWTPDERVVFGAEYLPPFVPTAYGEHLFWLWNRCREQRRFFPWYRPGDDNRLFYGAPTPENLSEEALDFLRAGDAYRPGYASAFESDAQLPKRLRVPTLLVASHPDPLAVHMERLSDLPELVQKRKTDDWDSARTAARDWLANTLTPTQPALHLPAGRHAMMALDTPEWQGRLHAIRGPAETRTLIVPQPGGSARAIFAKLDEDAMVLDLPGHGLSDTAAGLSQDPAAWARVIEAAARHAQLPLSKVALVLEGPTGALAAYLADDFAQVKTDMPSWLAERDYHRWLPDLAPDPSGAHLLHAWDALRERAIFDPPWLQEPGGYRPLGELDPERLAAQHLALLEASGASLLLDACHAAAKAGRPDNRQ